MYEFHGWFRLAETPDQVNAGGLAEKLAELGPAIAQFGPVGSSAKLNFADTLPCVRITGHTNRVRRDPGGDTDVDEFLDELIRLLPASWGMPYERSNDSADEISASAGGNSFRVRVLSQGTLTMHADPFLSPCMPVIEDANRTLKVRIT
jgi:hypothetical protein